MYRSYQTCQPAQSPFLSVRKTKITAVRTTIHRPNLPHKPNITLAFCEYYALLKFDLSFSKHSAWFSLSQKSSYFRFAGYSRLTQKYTLRRSSTTFMWELLTKIIAFYDHGSRILAWFFSLESQNDNEPAWRIAVKIIVGLKEGKKERRTTGKIFLRPMPIDFMPCRKPALLLLL